ncbi:ribonuclease P protein component 1 [Halobacteriaceae archaeon GCM10025711]
MALTPDTLLKHELAGLSVRVVESTDPSRVGIAGRVVRETMGTLLIATESGVKQVPKRGTTYEFALDEAAATREGAGTASEPDGEDVAYVTVDGATLLSRPARRTENGVNSKWH